MAAPGVVVWEWQNEHGHWRPYNPYLSTFIELNKTSTIPLQLGSVDPNMYIYSVDPQMMVQLRQGTGTQRPLRRSVYPANSHIAQGVTWQWSGDVPGNWHNYDIDVACFIEDNFKKNSKLIDLSKSPFFQPYYIDLSNMSQTRIETGTVRHIRRELAQGSYPLDSSAGIAQQNQNKSSSISLSNASSSNSVLNVNGKRSLTDISASGSKKSRLSLKRARMVMGISNSLGNPSPMSTTSMNSTVPSATSVIQGPSGTSGYVGQNMSTQTASTSSAITGNIPTGYQGPLTRNRYSALANSGLGNLSNGPVSMFPSTQSSQPLLFGASNFGHNASLFSSSGQNLLGGTSVGFGGSALYGGASVIQPTPSQHPQWVAVPGTSQGGLMGGGSSLVPNSGLSNSLQLVTNSRGSRIQPVVSSVTNVLVSAAAPGLVGSLQQQAPFLSSFPSGAASRPPLPKHGRIPNNAPKGGKGHQKSGSSAEEILHNYIEILAHPPTDEDCCICCEKLNEASGYASGSPGDHVVFKLSKCSHMFHKLCLHAMYDSGCKDGSVQCPTCKTIYGEKQGNCPKGEMEYRVLHQPLAGHESANTIQILYHISGGIQGPEHPHPGRRYSARGFPRIGYLPDTDKGRMVLQLLIIAWKRRITFTIGTSTTTGEDDTVTWNEIHHKTEFGTNYSGHGYPDPNYLDNVLLELAVHGISESDLQKNGSNG